MSSSRGHGFALFGGQPVESDKCGTGSFQAVDFWSNGRWFFHVCLEFHVQLFFQIQKLVLSRIGFPHLAYTTDGSFRSQAISHQIGVYLQRLAAA